MSEWYWSEDGQKHGPISSEELRTMARDGRLTPQTLIWRQGAIDWRPARKVKGLFASDREELQSPDADQPPPIPESVVGTTIDSARKHASTVVSDLKTLDFREEVLPLGETSVKTLLSDFVFWTVTILGVVPLLIVTVNQLQYQLTAFALFFAILWGVIFRNFVVKSELGWMPLLGSLFFTGVVGINGLLWLYDSAIPESYIKLTESKNGVVRLVGFILQTGVCEEVCKIIPVAFYLARRRAKVSGPAAVLLGVFSGLGFAAFENMNYGVQSITDSHALTRELGTQGLVLGVMQAMINVMLRSVSLVFCHGVWSGIFAYFLAVGHVTGRRRLALAVVGLTVSATLHGVYNWLVGVQQTFAASVVVVSFMLFYTYMSRLQTMEARTTPCVNEPDSGSSPTVQLRN